MITQILNTTIKTLTHLKTLSLLETLDMVQFPELRVKEHPHYVIALQQRCGRVSATLAGSLRGTGKHVDQTRFIVKSGNCKKRVTVISSYWRRWIIIISESIVAHLLCGNLVRNPHLTELLIITINGGICIYSIDIPLKNTEKYQIVTLWEPILLLGKL